MQHGPWTIECNLADGARIRGLQYEGTDLLTTEPPQFRPPAKNYGRYETRPVYGYDDCFPTVDRCGDWPDHGELCWLPWQGTETDCAVHSARWPATLRRRLECAPNALTWSFSVRNDGDRPLRFQHVMHALMPLDQITKLVLPVPGAAEKLLAIPRGKAEMLYLTDLPTGLFSVTLQDRLVLSVTFPLSLFPTLSVWWNNRGYPDEDGLRRCECAFEPTPGRNTMLTDGTTLAVNPRDTLSWEVRWEVARCR